MKLTWYSPAGISVEFSKDSEVYKLLVGVTGLHENPKPIHQVTQGPFQHGATRSLTLYEPRTVTIPVRVWGPGYQSLEQNGQYLAMLLSSHLGPGTLVYTRDDGKEFSLTCIADGECPGNPTNQTWNTYHATITLIAYDPFWYSYPISRTDFSAGTPLQFPFKFPFRFPLTTPVEVIVNDGNMASPVTIAITGAIVNPTITRVYSDAYGTPISEAISFTLTMTVGEVLTITTGPDNPTITLLHDDTTYDTNPFQYLNANPKFWQLQPGNNTVTLSDVSIGDDTVMTVLHASRYSAV